MLMKQLLNTLVAGRTLSESDARNLATKIVSSEISPVQSAASLALLASRSLSTSEIAGFRDVVFEHRTPVDLGTDETIDVCGTGGDHKNTFNISTIASFIVAGAGVKVAKHGNYGISSLCGSSTVLEKLGVQFTADSSVLKRQLEECSICYLHAPLFHPVLKQIAPLRRDLGIRTIFNLLGPLLNPASPKYQLIGVPDYNTLSLFRDYLADNAEKRFFVVSSKDGYDEVSLTDDFYLGDKDRIRIVKPKDIGFRIVEQADLRVDSALDPSQTQDTLVSYSQTFLDILSGDEDSENIKLQKQRNVAIVNAAYAICLAKNVLLPEAVEVARESIISKRAIGCFEKFAELSRTV
jgi:anthranilate phosphoribosyltransferase